MEFSGATDGVGDWSLGGDQDWHDELRVLFLLEVLMVFRTPKGIVVSSFLWVRSFVTMSCMLWNMLAIAECSSSRETSWAEEGGVCSRGARLCCCGHDVA